MANVVLLVGRLCADPELKYTPSGIAVANFRIAVDRPFTSASGERETDFIDIVTWRQNAEFVNSYVTKGRLVLIEGHLQVRSWQAPDGQKRKAYEVVAERVKALDKPREPREPGEGGGMPARNSASNQREEYHAPPPSEAPDFDVPDITDPFADQ